MVDKTSAKEVKRSILRDGTNLSIHAAALRATQALPVTVEVGATAGIPGITIVGMPDTAILESRNRIRLALKSCGFMLPRVHITVNLSPADVKKQGTGFDLPIAIAVLAATGQISSEYIGNYLYAGELGLDGYIRPIRGTVSIAELASQQHLAFVGSPASQLTPFQINNFIPINHLADLSRPIAELRIHAQESFAYQSPTLTISQEKDFIDVLDQDLAKRALVVAAAGKHGILMQGPPGAGKSMLAERIPGILPLLSRKEMDEVAVIHSAAGELIDKILAGIRPYRAPHHASSLGGMLGGGTHMKPGELALAHAGVLFLDELPEFDNRVLQALRQPMENHEVRLSRVDGTYTFPADFQLVAAANPCPCGNLGTIGKTCTCSQQKISSYQSKLTGPLIDRIDMYCDVKLPKPEEVIDGKTGLSTYDMKKLVSDARLFAHARKQGEITRVEQAKLDCRASRLLENMSNQHVFGARAIIRLARVARTIANLDCSDVVSEDHMLEAIHYRVRS